jgi:hypothetical protein
MMASVGGILDGAIAVLCLISYILGYLFVCALIRAGQGWDIEGEYDESEGIDNVTTIGSTD